MSILAFILLGIVAGFLARALMPGRQPMGLVGTAAVGMVGSRIGGFVGNLLAGERALDLEAAGLIGSILGAIVVLMIVGSSRRRTLV